jgi:hypothetical protein
MSTVYVPSYLALDVTNWIMLVFHLYYIVTNSHSMYFLYGMYNLITWHFNQFHVHVLKLMAHGFEKCGSLDVPKPAWYKIKFVGGSRLKYYCLLCVFTCVIACNPFIVYMRNDNVNLCTIPCYILVLNLYIFN